MSLNYYSSCNLTYNDETNTLKAFNCPTQWLDKENNITNPVYFNLKGFHVMEKIYKVASKEELSTFITLTTTGDLDTLNKLLKKIRLSYNSRFHIPTILSKTKGMTNLRAKSIQQENTIKFIDLEIQKIHALFLISKKRNVTQISKTSKKYKSLYKDIKYRMDNSPDSEWGYFRVLETQKNGKPHYHILSTHYIPMALIDIVYERDKNLRDTSRIYDVQYLYDTYLRRKRKDLFERYKQDKPYAYDLIRNSSLHKNNILEYTLKYVTKYIVKEPDKTFINLKQNGYNNVRIFGFSRSLTNKYDFLKKQTSAYRFLSSIKEALKIPNFEMSDLWSFDREIGERSSYFTQFLEKEGLFSMNRNNIYLNFEKEFEIISKENNLDKLKDIDLEDKETKKHLLSSSVSYSKPGFYEELKTKWLLQSILKYVYNRNLTYTLPMTSTHTKYFSDKFSDPDKFRAFSSFVSSPIFKVLGRAGCGKSYFLEHLGKLCSDKTELILLTKKKRVSKKFLIAYESLGFNVKCYNIDDYLIKRGPVFIKNQFNCDKSEKDVILMFDEIGQISYKELLSTFASINLSNIKKIIFAGDIKQDKSFVGDSLISLFDNLPYISSFELNTNYRSNNQLTYKFNQFLENREINELEVLDFYTQPDKLKIEVEQLLKDNYIILCNSRRLRDTINEIAHELPIQKKVMVDKNFKSSALYLTNGDQYIIDKFQEGFYHLKGESKDIVVSQQIFDKYFIYSYSMTIDKVQGEGFENVAVMFDNYSPMLMTHNKLYTGMTRAKTKLKVYFRKFNVYERSRLNDVQNNDLFKLHKLSEIILLVASSSFNQKGLHINEVCLGSKTQTPLSGPGRIRTLIVGVRNIYKL